MKKTIPLAALVLLTASFFACKAAKGPNQDGGGSAMPVTVENLRCEYLPEPSSLDVANPRLSWILASDRRGEKQTAYQILVSSLLDRIQSGAGDLWDSGRVKSDETSQIVYRGQPLVSREECFWKVRVWDRDGRASGWSAVARWRMGLLQKADWTAKWIVPASSEKSKDTLIIRRAIYEGVTGGGSLDVTEKVKNCVAQGRLNLLVNNQTLGGDPAYGIVKRLRIEYEYNGESATQSVNENQSLEIPKSSLPYIRKSFVLKTPVRRAVLYATALGLYEARINGRRVGDQVLAPDWTDYRKRVRYQAYDVTDLLGVGENVIGALLANGWYGGHIGNGQFQFFGKQPAFLAQLEITHADGTTETIGTDETWKSQDSPILSSDFMLGEDYDSRREITGWDAPGLADSNWNPVSVRAEPTLKLEGQVMEPVRATAELKPRKITEPKPGQWIFDLGQNMVGVVRLKVSAPAGTKITLRHAEMLNPDGTVYTENLRGAPSVDHYICKGGGIEIWQPRFTFHGFRYVELTGLTNAPAADAVTGIVISTDTRNTGQFACSDPRLNQLQSNIQWGQRGNYLSVPTDCPQRDERLGWLGDAQIFIRTAAYNADIAAFFTKWLVDVDDGQSADGAFGDVSPETMGCKGTPAWGDAGVICPWTVYEMYGDKRVLEQHLPAMTNWVEYVRQHTDHLIWERDRGSDYGDWLSINANTPKDLIGTAFFAYSTHLVAQSYHTLGRDAEAVPYDRLFEEIKAAFNKRYVSSDGRVASGTQCAYVLALKFELLPAELRPKATEHFVSDINAKGGHLSTGFVGVSHLLPVLSNMGRADVAYQLLLQDTFPSWLFSVKHGATTIWERWDGWTPEKGFQSPSMNSFNHYSLGSCGEYLFEGVGGIRPARPGFKNILIQPVIGNGLTWANASYDSIRGKIATAWKCESGRLSLEVTIPANTTAIVVIPAKDQSELTESAKPVTRAEGVKLKHSGNGVVQLEVESGTYHFESPM
jgi:alpha-L-rhamnosidase